MKSQLKLASSKNFDNFCEISQVNDVCRMEYVIAKQHQLIGRQLPIPDCEDLSPITSPDHFSCIRLGVQSEPLVEGKLLNIASE